MPTNGPESTVREFSRAFNEGNVDAVLKLYEPQAVLLWQPDQTAAGTDALRMALRKFSSMKPTLTMGKYRLVIAGDIALSIVNWTLAGVGPDSKPVQMAGTTSDVLRRQPDVRWLFVIDNPWGADVLP